VTEPESLYLQFK